MTRLLTSLSVATLLLAPTLVDAQGVVRMVGLPFEPAGGGDVGVYIAALYRISIGVAAALVVLRLILAGAKYMLSDIVTTKADAKRDIWTSILGLVVVLSAVLILETINPQLTNLRVLNLEQVRPPALPQAEQCDVQSSASCCSSSGGNWVVNSGVGTCNTGSESRDELEDDVAENTIDEAIENGEFTTVVEVYNLDEIPLSDRQDYVSNVWPDQCELDNNGEENGNLFREVENVQAGVIRYVCVTP